MEIRSTEIVDRLENEFAGIYRPFAKFQGKPLWGECLVAVKNPELMGHINFNNNTMGIPPVVSFLSAPNGVPDTLSDDERKFIGAFWGFVFRKVFGCGVDKMVAAGGVKGVKSAALFTPHEHKVV